MDFKQFFYEDVKLLRQLSQDKQQVYLGKFSWWHVYTVPPDEKDFWPLDESNKKHIKRVLDESAYKLASLGFPSMTSTIIITEVNKPSEANPITGGGSIGLAHRQGHGIAVDYRNFSEDVIIHEHAHMYWFNLPKEYKRYFFEYFYKKAGALERLGKSRMVDGNKDYKSRFQYPSPEFSNLLSSQEGEELRNILTSKGFSVSNYGAANVDELWATTVEAAAMKNPPVSKKLKDLINKTINGF